MNFLKILGKEFTSTQLYILTMSSVSGIFAGISMSVANQFLKDFTPGNIDFIDFIYPLLCLFTISAFLFTKRIALRKARALVENNIAKIRLTITKQIRQAEFMQIENFNEADIIVKITTDGRKISRSVEQLINAVQAVITIFFCLIYIGWLSLSVLFLLLIFFAIGFLVSQYQNNIINPEIHELTDKETELFGSVNHILEGFKELKINSKKDKTLFYSNLIPLLKKVKQQIIYVDSKFTDISTFQMGLFYFSWLCIAILLTGTDKAIVYQIAVTTLFFFPCIVDIMISFPIISKASVAIQRLYKLQQELESHVEPDDIIYQPDTEYIKSFKEIKLERVLFNYTDKEADIAFSTGPVTLSIKQGEILFITGGNGSGKSTLLKMITGLYPIFSGSVQIDNRQINIAEHQYLFSTVFTDFHLFNALYGIESIDIQKVAELLNLFKLNHKTRLTGNRFSNIDLSTGQKKRLALIIALMEDKPIYILDEWAADQDPDFRKYFYEVLLKKLKKQGKTVIAVSHDERYFYVADRIVKMGSGRIVDS